MTKGPVLHNLWEGLPEERKRRIQARAQEQQSYYQALSTLRHCATLTPVRLAETLNKSPSEVSQLAQDADKLISTLRDHIEAMGGKLQLTVKLPDEPPIVLAGLDDLIEASRPDADPL